MIESEVKSLNDYQWFILNILVFSTRRTYPEISLEEVRTFSHYEYFKKRWYAVEDSKNAKVERDLNKTKNL